MYSQQDYPKGKTPIDLPHLKKWARYTESFNDQKESTDSYSKADLAGRARSALESLIIKDNPELAPNTAQELHTEIQQYNALEMETRSAISRTLDYAPKDQLALKMDQEVAANYRSHVRKHLFWAIDHAEHVPSVIQVLRERSAGLRKITPALTGRLGNLDQKDAAINTKLSDMRAQYPELKTLIFPDADATKPKITLEDAIQEKNLILTSILPPLDAALQQLKTNKNDLWGKVHFYVLNPPEEAKYSNGIVYLTEGVTKESIILRIQYVYQQTQIRKEEEEKVDREVKSMQQSLSKMVDDLHLPALPYAVEFQSVYSREDMEMVRPMIALLKQALSSLSPQQKTMLDPIWIILTPTDASAGRPDSCAMIHAGLTAAKMQSRIATALTKQGARSSLAQFGEAVLPNGDEAKMLVGVANLKTALEKTLSKEQKEWFQKHVKLNISHGKNTKWEEEKAGYDTRNSGVDYAIITFLTSQKSDEMQETLKGALQQIKAYHESFNHPPPF